MGCHCSKTPAVTGRSDRESLTPPLSALLGGRAVLLEGPYGPPGRRTAAPRTVLSRPPLPSCAGANSRGRHDGLQQAMSRMQVAIYNYLLKMSP